MGQLQGRSGFRLSGLTEWGSGGNSTLSKSVCLQWLKNKTKQTALCIYNEKRVVCPNQLVFIELGAGGLRGRAQGDHSTGKDPNQKALL